MTLGGSNPWMQGEEPSHACASPTTPAPNVFSAQRAIEMALGSDILQTQGEKPPHGPANPTTPGPNTTRTTAEPLEGVDEAFAALLLINHEMHRQAKVIEVLVKGSGMASGDIQRDLKDNLLWLQGNLDTIQRFDTGDDETSNLLHQELESNLGSFPQAMKSIMDMLTARGPDTSSQETAAEIVNTSKALNERERENSNNTYREQVQPQSASRQPCDSSQLTDRHDSKCLWTPHLFMEQYGAGAPELSPTNCSQGGHPCTPRREQIYST